MIAYEIIFRDKSSETRTCNSTVAQMIRWISNEEDFNNFMVDESTIKLLVCVQDPGTCPWCDKFKPVLAETAPPQGNVKNVKHQA